MEYEMVVTAVTVLPCNAPIYSERATTIRLEDEAAGLVKIYKSICRITQSRYRFGSESPG